MIPETVMSTLPTRADQSMGLDSIIEIKYDVTHIIKQQFALEESIYFNNH